MYQSRYQPVFNAVCPYYKCEYALSITCEDDVDGDKEGKRFATEQEKNEHILKCCMCYPNDCKISQKFDKKYEE